MPSVPPSKVENGTIKVSPTRAAKNGDTVKMTNFGSGKYTFTKPAWTVEVQVSFRVADANPFMDVRSSDYYYDAVLWAVENGVTKGASATTFSPDATVIRTKGVTFQWRAAGSTAASDALFRATASDAYYAEAVAWAVKNEITVGTGSNLFSPETVVSRGQAVTFLCREEK